MDGWKKCPFCGGEVIVDDRKSYQRLVKQYGRACLQAQCGNDDCGCALTVHFGDSASGSYADMLRILRDKWNRRAQ